MEKLRLEVTVMLTEKGQLSREYRRVTTLYAKVKQESKEQAEKLNMMIDEVHDLNKKNGEYRGLIAENDHTINMM